VVSTLTSRTLLVIATCQALAGCGTRVIQPPVVPRTGQVELFGSFIVERARTAHDGRPDVGGLSGGWYDRQTRRIWTVSDDVQRPRLVASLLMISDDNFNDRQVTACLVLAMNR
jgi:hypothetical protein